MGELHFTHALFPPLHSHYQTLLLQFHQFVRRHFEHVAPQVEKIVSFRILQIIYLLIVANLQRLRVLLCLNELNQSFSHSLRHLFSGLKGEIDEKGAVLDARVHRVLLGGIEGEYF